MFAKLRGMTLWAETQLFNRPNLLKNGDNYDKTLLSVLLCLLCLGLVMVFSASAAQRPFEGRFYFFIKQVQFAGVGLAVSLILSRVMMWRWRRWAMLLMFLTILMLLGVAMFGEEINGARRWINLPFGMKFQPSELLKLATILYMADFFKRKVEVWHDYKRVLMVGIPILVGLMAVAATLDLGSMLVVAGLFLAMLYLVNLPLKLFFGSVAIVILGAAGFIFSSEFRMRRMAVMWQPWVDENGTGYQGLGSLLSMQNGSFFGKGLGNAIFKRGFLPEAHTDFVLAVIGEELGLLTVALLIGVYFWIVWRAFSIGKQARDLALYFNSFVAIGIGLWVAAQSFINIGVNISLLPNKGLTLPLISYGGTSLLMMMVAFTLLLRVDYENRRVLRGFSVADPRDRQPENAVREHTS